MLNSSNGESTNNQSDDYIEHVYDFRRGKKGDETYFGIVRRGNSSPCAITQDAIFAERLCRLLDFHEHLRRFYTDVAAEIEQGKMIELAEEEEHWAEEEEHREPVLSVKELFDNI